MDTLWSMFHDGRFIMDIKFIDIDERVSKVHSNKFASLDGLTEYYLFEWSK